MRQNRRLSKRRGSGEIHHGHGVGPPKGLTFRSRRTSAPPLNSGVRQLVKLQSQSWQQSGSVMLWRYTENQRNFPGWHLTADPPGCASLIALLDAFAADGTPISRTLTVTAPTQATLAVPNNRSAAPVVPAKLRISFSQTATGWSFPQSINPAELSVGADWLPVLRQAIAGIPRGKGDYSIGPPDSGSLWLWWQPAAA